MDINTHRDYSLFYLGLAENLVLSMHTVTWIPISFYHSLSLLSGCVHCSLRDIVATTMTIYTDVWY